MRNVSIHPDGLLVRVRRNGVVHQRLVAGHSEQARRRAQMLAAALRAKHPEVSRRRPGISEGADRFHVGYYDEQGRRHNKTFHFRQAREEAKARAEAFLRRLDQRGLLIGSEEHS